MGRRARLSGVSGRRRAAVCRVCVSVHFPARVCPSVSPLGAVLPFPWPWPSPSEYSLVCLCACVGDASLPSQPLHCTSHTFLAPRPTIAHTQYKREEEEEGTTRTHTATQTDADAHALQDDARHNRQTRPHTRNEGERQIAHAGRTRGGAGVEQRQSTNTSERVREHNKTRTRAHGNTHTHTRTRRHADRVDPDDRRTDGTGGARHGALTSSV